MLLEKSAAISFTAKTMSRFISVPFVLFALKLFVPSLATAAVGFSVGNNFQIVAISGEVSVSCPGLQSAVTYTCRDVVLDPSNHAFLLGPAGLDADAVNLSVARQDGTTRSDSADYLSDTTRTSSEFNLWESAVINRPLLKEGKNTVAYNFTKNGVSKLSGNFIANVSRGASRLCQKTNYNSPFPDDCRSQYTVCENYFEQFNYCR